MSEEIISPIREIVARLHHHAEVGFVAPNNPSSPAVKILAGLTIMDAPQMRADDQNDLPNLVICPPSGKSVDMTNAAYFVESEVVLELSVSKDHGTAGTDGKSLMEMAQKVITAVLRSRDGTPDPHLAKTVPNRLAFSFSDGIPNDSSLLLPITVKWRTKPFI